MQNFSGQLLLTVLLLGPVMSVYSQTLKEETSLFDKPDGAKIFSGKSGTAVKIKRREGFWVEVDILGKSAWVQLSKINLGGNAGGSVNIDTGRTSTGNIVSTSSARGLSAKDLLDGKPDKQAVTKLEVFVTEVSAVRRFRSEGGIIALAEKVVLTAPVISATEKKTTSQPVADDNFDTPKLIKKANDDW
jgi:hypothetical protein